MSRNIVKNSVNKTFGAVNSTNLLKNRVLESRELANKIIIAAETERNEITSEAQRAAAELRETSYNEGHAKAASEFTEIIAAAYEKRESVLHEVERDVLKLSIKLAEKIIGRELQTDKKTLADIVATALRNVRQQERLIVRINPSDLAQIQEFKAFINQAGRAQFIDFEPDPKVNSGGCIIESEVGTVDARLETQLKILERTLLRQADDNAEESS